MISYIIPHKNRLGILEKHIELLMESIFTDYEVIIVDDGSNDKNLPDFSNEKIQVVKLEKSHGPAYARNTGAKLANGDILLFVGDDCLPVNDLLLQHSLSHSENVSIVQGFTTFHPNVCGTFFQDFLDGSGLQANWSGLKTENGEWKKDSNGFFLTTNVSIKKDAFFDLGMFNESFHMAAWEDVEFGIRASREHHKSILNPSAINFHVHGYTYKQFCQRQFMEGTQRLIIAVEHPEMATSLINPGVLREAKKWHINEVINNGLMLPVLSLFTDQQYKMWNEGLQLMSQMGIIAGIKERGGIYNVLLHIHTERQVLIATGGIRALEKGDFGYAQHCKLWLIEEGGDNWAIQMFAAEVDRASNDNELAEYYWKKANEIAFNEKWVKEW